MQELKKLDISFQNEDDLRLKGYDKTPDVKLNIPIGRHQIYIYFILKTFSLSVHSYCLNLNVKLLKTLTGMN